MVRDEICLEQVMTLTLSYTEFKYSQNLLVPELLGDFRSAFHERPPGE